MVAVVTVLLSVHPATRLFAQCPDGSPPPCQRDFTTGRVAIDPNAVAILPFRVSGPPEAQYLREGMLDLLSISLDGFAGWRVVHPRTLLVLTSSTGGFGDDVGTSAQTARNAGAATMILGRAIALGPQLRLHAELYDAVGGRRIAAVEATGELARPAPVVDSLVTGLLKQRLLSHPETHRQSLEEYSTSSPGALRAYLVAEQLERRADWQTAIDSLRSAIAQDSGFGLAYFRLYNVQFYGGNLGGLPIEILSRAMGHLNRLPVRQADLLRLANAEFEGRRAEALRRADDLAARYPDDIDVAREQGETYFHLGLTTGEPPTRAVTGFLRAMRLDPGLIESYQHAIELLCLVGDTAQAWSALHRVRALVPDYLFTSALELAMRAAIRGEDPTAIASTIEPAQRGALLGQAQIEALRILDANPARGIALADRFAELLSADDRPKGERSTALRRRHLYALAAGQWRSAWMLLRDAEAADPGSGLVGIAIHALVTATHNSEGRVAARDNLTRDSTDFSASILVAWGAVVDNDTTTFQAATQHAKAQAGLYRAYVEAEVSGLVGLRALQVGDTVRARQFLAAATAVRPFLAYMVSNLAPDARFAVTLAALERTTGDLAAAGRHLYDTFLPEGFLYRAEAEELRGQIAEQQADTAAAIRALHRFVDLWRDADPELQSRVAAARAALARLER